MSVMRAVVLRSDFARFSPPKPPPRMTMWGLFLLMGRGVSAGAAADAGVEAVAVSGDIAACTIHSREAMAMPSPCRSKERALQPLRLRGRGGRRRLGRVVGRGRGG